MQPSVRELITGTVLLLLYLPPGIKNNPKMSVPRVEIRELSKYIQRTTDETTKRVLTGILDDYMDLQFEKETPYTKGLQILPTGTTIEDVEYSAKNETDPKLKAIFEKISETYKAGVKTPQTNDGSWPPKCTPILVLVTPNYND